MTEVMWNKWLSRFNADMRRQKRRVLLLCDNASAHKKFNSKRYRNVRIEFLAPGLTAYLQPLDAGIIRCFKAHFRRAQIRRAIARDDAGEDKIYHMEQLEAMQLAQVAWDSVSVATIVNCWRHTGIIYLPNAESRGVDENSATDDNALNDLQAGLDCLAHRHSHTPQPAREWVESDQQLETEAGPLDEDIVANVQLPCEN
ncbi:putative tigger transposable element derived-like protein [Rhizoctonia solani 123E]|uniref:Putative tigger transposable element derived-like protein n=1 Tax=Rhizoctonia solani 123E TaxID=1423351 RepID=A0A074RQU6_9AGAM|nr:putative tigger transposable element derived-like protein [Rhizoctonia solani 123E]